MHNFTHNSVLLAESIQALNINPQGIYIDGTFGRGGHSAEIAKQLTTGRVIAFDKDLDALDFFHKNNTNPKISLVHSDFANIYNYLHKHSLVGEIDGVLLDLGVSSPQLDDKSRGFSFMGEDTLDMRMDRSNPIDAKTWLKTSSEEEIANIIYQYGEERRSRIIAKKIKEFQQKNELNTTKQLADIISSIVPKTGKKHPATKTFQAIRIHINSELTSLEKFLNTSIDILKPQARLVIITFHSLEDRIVKRFIKQYSKVKPANSNLPKGLPSLTNDKIFMPLKEIKKLKPSKEEIKNNVRSRSSILRIAEKC